jgi:hypothetical protein
MPSLSWQDGMRLSLPGCRAIVVSQEMKRLTDLQDKRQACPYMALIRFLEYLDNETTFLYLEKFDRSQTW